MHTSSIIGSGCAGLTCCDLPYAGARTLHRWVWPEHELGVTAFPTHTPLRSIRGFPDGIMGRLLSENVPRRRKIRRLIQSRPVTEVDVRKAPVQDYRRKRYPTKRRSLIVAAGASARLLGLKAKGN